MKEKKEHLNIDFDFLDNKEKVKETKKKPKLNWGSILGIGFFVLIIGSLFFSDSDSSTNTSSSGSTSNTNSGLVRNGEFECSSYDSAQADKLLPKETKDQIDRAQDLIIQRGKELDRLENEINNSYVNEYSSQYAIDMYNEKVDTYNTKLNSYKRDLATMDSRIDQFNLQVKKHNDYLISHCTKVK